jgi:hypothetical protein
MLFDDVGFVQGNEPYLGIKLEGSPPPGKYQVGVEFRGAGVASEAVVIRDGSGSVQTCPLPTTTNAARFRCMINISFPGAGPLAISRQRSDPNGRHSGGLEIMKIVLSAQPDLPPTPPAKK